ncbi:hypothetical protein AB9M10_15590 [Rhodococcus erythropolis]
MRNVSKTTDKNATNSIGIELTDLAHAVLDSDHQDSRDVSDQVSAAVAAWNARVDDTELAHIYDDQTMLNTLAVRPEWSHPDLDETGTNPNLRAFSSESVTTTLSMHHGWRIDPFRAAQAAAGVSIRKMLHFAEPTIHLVRTAGNIDDKDRRRPQRTAGSAYNLTLEEAAQLAHTLLAAVDTARGTAD